ncbi:MAG: hypothetical protein GEU74_07720 [Nitriliruptorales bacterium]|nr:hypothetical protein [Nitriliruptorales bacterium]
MSDEPFVLQPGEGRAIDLGGFLMTVRVTTEDTNGAFTLLEAEEPPNFGPPMHIHHDAAEAFFVLDGDEVATAVHAGELDDARLGAIAERYRMEVLGPVPEGYV